MPQTSSSGMSHLHVATAFHFLILTFIPFAESGVGVAAVVLLLLCVVTGCALLQLPKARFPSKLHLQRTQGFTIPRDIALIYHNFWVRLHIQPEQHSNPTRPSIYHQHPGCCLFVFILRFFLDTVTPILPHSCLKPITPSQLHP
jgi:hypothetical protein